ncbi:MAG: hypothetical protein A2V70_06775 [Planctomycetes bacterium RBG_13_63_9]|nr:MAG: hypothetical protein A2V70_06775 [Planctomycetes bacterium RBG_13_63_9]
MGRQLPSNHSQVSLFSRLVKHVAFPLNELREGTRVLPLLRRLEATQYADAESLHRLRLEKLRALLQHAYHNTIFHRRRFDEAGIRPEDVREFDDLRLLPPMSKGDIVRHQRELVARNLPPAQLRRTATGGSTGTHTPFVRDKDCYDVKRAAEFRFNQWIGWHVGEKVAVVWPAIQDVYGPETLKAKLRHMFVDRHVLFYAGQLDERLMGQIAGRLHRFAPSLIRTFPNTLAILSKYIRDATRYRIRPKGIWSSGEPLLPSQRALFEEVFQCPVFNCYAARECGHAASECEAHDGLHINAECLHLEFEMHGKPVPAGEPGYLLITDFDNLGMPFIRYQIEDIGVPLAGSCRCGRSLPRMDVCAGRVSDFVRSPHDGSLVSGAILVHDLVAEGPDVGQLQVVQDAEDHLILRINRGSRGVLGATETQHVRNVIDRVFHGAMRLTIVPVQSIPREKSGKHRVFISCLSQPDLAQDCVRH